MGVFFSLAWLGRGAGFGGWLVGAFLVGIVGAGVFLAWAWIVGGARLSVLGVLWRLAVLLVRGGHWRGTIICLLWAIGW